MPHIHWRGLPLGVREHLLERLRSREIKPEDILEPDQWIRSNPEVPDGPWWKEFRAFKLAGVGQHPKTFLTKDQFAFGIRL